MAEGKPPPSLQDLEDRLREAETRSDKGGGKDRDQTSGGLALGMRIAVELVAGVVVGVGVGLLLDYWLGTKPWMLVVFFFLGSAAGMLNVYRTVAGLGGGVGYADGPGGKQDTDRRAARGGSDDEHG